MSTLLAAQTACELGSGGPALSVEVGTPSPAVFKEATMSQLVVFDLENFLAFPIMVPFPSDINGRAALLGGLMIGVNPSDEDCFMGKFALPSKRARVVPSAEMKDRCIRFYFYSVFLPLKAKIFTSHKMSFQSTILGHCQ